MLELKHVSVVYDPHTKFKKEALIDVSLTIKEGERVAIVGKIGSGKSTLIEVLDGLIRITSGSVIIDGLDITKSKIPRKEIVKRIGVVFQHPEQQFFAETVFEEIAYGVRNLGAQEDVVKEYVLKAIEDVGLSGDYLEKSPFALSGGEKRRVAIASVIAMDPKYLILDEPTSNLDYAGKKSIMQYIEKIFLKDKTLIFVTHDMDEAFKLSERVIALSEGRVVFDGPTNDFFLDAKLIETVGLGKPFQTELYIRLSNCFKNFPLQKDLNSIVDEIEKRKKVHG